MHRSYVPILLLIPILSLAVSAQETRSTINGRVTDQLAAPVAKVKVTIVNVDTNVTTAVETNETGYFEAPLLIPGNYKLTGGASGFKTEVRPNIVLAVGQVLTVDMRLELGSVTETIQVTAEVPVLDINSVEAGALIDNKELMDLPVLGNNPTLLAKFAAGMQADGVNNYLGLHSIAGGSAYNNAGGVGGNEWSIDGVPNNGGGRQAAYLPYSDSVSEFRIDTTGFDVSQGRGTGASIIAMTKAGTNQYHGTLTEQHWQQRYNGTPYFTRQLYFKGIADAEAKGDTALANQLRNTQRQPSGHSNNWAATIGGPVVIPKIYNGKNKLFYFFSYNGFKDTKTEEANQFNKTVPTMANRDGDFSKYLAIDAVKYQLYEPLSVRRDTGRTGGTYFIRDPIPGNIIAKSRILMPKMYKFISDLYPVPNNDPLSSSQEPRNNYLATSTPWLWEYVAYQNRIDFNANNYHRFFGRWSWNNFDEDRQDWTYSTIRGMNTGGLNRKNRAATLGWTWTINNTTLLDISGAANEFTTGNRKPVPLSYKPTDLGLPKYLDDWAGDRSMIPRISVSGYTDPVPDGIPTFTQFRVYSVVSNVTHMRGKHSVKGGFDLRMSHRTGGGGGNTSGYFRFDNRYTRRYGDTALYSAGDIGLSWAAFMLGLNYDSQISAGNETYATFSPYYGGYLQDSWRVTRKLTINLGFRLEWEGGPTERYNRVIGYFDKDAKVFVADTAESLYRANPTVASMGLTADAFKVRGGVTFPGVNDVPRAAWQGQAMFMPRVAFAYAVSSKTVIRGGVGSFYDTLNVTNNSPNQTGFNRTTTYSSDSNAGTTWRTGNPAAGISPMMDPFPVSVTGSRFDLATKGSLGVDTLTGRSYSYNDFTTKRAFQNRWRLGMQRQIGSKNVLSVTYAGSYSRDVGVSIDLNPVPSQFWWNGNSRNSALESNLNGGVTNPFRITNFTNLAAANPALYADMNGQSFFTNSTLSRAQMLKAFPSMTGLTQTTAPWGRVRTNGLEATFSRRFSKGWSGNLAYTATKAAIADFFPNSYDRVPAWRPSTASRPHRVTASGIYQFPFGQGRTYLRRGLVARLVGGMQLSGTFEYQPGQYLDWSNRYYYGDPADIVKDKPTLGEWFNTQGTTCTQTAGTDTGWERCSQRGPASYQVRVFPSRIEGLRRDKTFQTNANIQKEIPVRDGRYRFYLRFDMLNVFNRYQFDSPNTDPMSTNFGMVQQQTAAVNRFLQFQLRMQF